MISLECFIAVRAFLWHSFTSAFPYVSPLQSVLVSEVERSIIRILVLPLLFLLGFVGYPIGPRSE